MAASQRKRRAARRPAARRRGMPGTSSINKSADTPIARKASPTHSAYESLSGARSNVRSLRGRLGGCAVMGVGSWANFRCELVLFMLMPEDRCEGHHVGASVALTILCSPHYPEVGALTRRLGPRTALRTSETRLVKPGCGSIHDYQRRFCGPGGFPLPGCGLDGARPLAEYARRVPRRSYRARPLARRAHRSHHAHLAPRPAGVHRLAGAWRGAAALDRAAAAELPALLPLLHARGRDKRRSDRADRHAQNRALAAALAHRGGGRVTAVRPGGQ